jgi:hypothetical protein
MEAGQLSAVPGKQAKDGDSLTEVQVLCAAWPHACRLHIASCIMLSSNKGKGVLRRAAAHTAIGKCQLGLKSGWRGLA